MYIYYIIIVVNDMKKLNNKGFTLVELIATVVILSIVMGIGAYSITGIIRKNKENDCKLLINEIKDAVELYYQECKYSSSDAIDCPAVTEYNGVDSYEVKLNDLVKYGFLKANGTDEDDNPILVNPNDNIDIGDCKIMYMYIDGDFKFDYDGSVNFSCPNIRQ